MTTVISFLVCPCILLVRWMRLTPYQGAYVSLTHLFLRTKPTPITDALRVVVSAMKKRGIKRLLALSIPAHSLPGEQVRHSAKSLTYSLG